MPETRRRILVAVEPQLLRDAIERVLTAAGVDDVVAISPGTSPDGEPDFDGAIVSSPPAELTAPVVIDLTDPEHGRGFLRTAEGDEVIDLRDMSALIDLLDEHVGGATSRRDTLGVQDL